MSLELDRKSIESAIKVTMGLAKSICDGLKSDDHFKIQMAYNAALYIKTCMERLNDFKNPYIKTGMDLALNPQVKSAEGSNNPHPIYMWEEQEDEGSEGLEGIIDSLDSLLRKLKK